MITVRLNRIIRLKEKKKVVRMNIENVINIQTKPEYISNFISRLLKFEYDIFLSDTRGI